MRPLTDRLPALRLPALLLAAVLLAHALLLGWTPWPPSGWRRAAARPALALRTVAVARVPAGTEAPAGPAAAPVVAPAVSPPQREPPPAAAPAADRPLPAAVAAADPAASSPAPAIADTGAQELPTYPTRLPAALQLRYALQRGGLAGQAVLDWQPDADGRYRLALHGSAHGLDLLAWTSQGGVDAAGIAPERFVDRRPRRGALAVNFQRERGIVSFSGPQLTYTLVPGTQDRASWLLQLTAIVDAAPALYEPGATIAMFVVGPRGDGDVWAFEVAGREAVETPAGRADAALKLTRAPRRPYDTRVEVWLDPARGHLPVRLRMANAPAGEPTELLLAGQEP